MRFWYFLHKLLFNPLHSGNPYTGTFANSDDPDEMQQNAALHQGLQCKGKKYLQTKEYTFFFLNYNLNPLNMYNGLSQVYCIKPEGRIH